MKRFIEDWLITMFVFILLLVGSYSVNLLLVFINNIFGIWSVVLLLFIFITLLMTAIEIFIIKKEK